MNLFDLAEFDGFVSGLPGVSLVDQWDSRVAKVGDKVFTLLSPADDGARITLKCSEESFEILTALEGIGQAPYFAKRKWISVAATAPLSEDELSHYIRRSYNLVAEGLTRKRRAELGIVTLD